MKKQNENKIAKQKTISKFLSLVLRHQPDMIHLQLDENGWANVQELIGKCANKKVYFTFEELKEMVENNDKQRFSFDENKEKIRANQGHSIQIDLALTPQTPPDFLYHGTAISNLDSINQKGIEKRNRQHVHLSENKETAQKVGSRHGKPIVLVILAKKMHENGILFYRSENGVWLTDFVDSNYISK